MVTQGLRGAGTAQRNGRPGLARSRTAQRNAAAGASLPGQAPSIRRVALIVVPTGLGRRGSCAGPRRRRAA